MTTCCGKPMRKVREQMLYGRKFVKYECRYCHKLAVENASVPSWPYSPPVGIP